MTLNEKGSNRFEGVYDISWTYVFRAYPLRTIAGETISGRRLHWIGELSGHWYACPGNMVEFSGGKCYNLVGGIHAVEGPLREPINEES